MYRDIEERLSLLPAPTVMDERNFDELLAENIEALKRFLGEEYIPLESDPFMKKLRVLTLRQLHNIVDKNETIKQLLVTTATGANLDNLGASVGVFRDAGEYPVALFEFSLSVDLDYDVVVPKGTVLNSDDDRYKSLLLEDVVIKAGELVGRGKVALQVYTKTSEIKTENIVTDMPFVVSAEQLESFSGGDEAEDDDRYRVRIISSFSRFSTAGSYEAYEYWTYSADSRIDDVVIVSPEPMVVDVYIHSFSGVDDVMIKRVEDKLNDRYVRPLSDKVNVKKPVYMGYKGKAIVFVKSLLDSGEIGKRIRANFDNSFYIGQDLPKSEFFKKCHVAGVVRVVSDFEDIIVSDTAVINSFDLDLEFREVA